MRNEMQAAKHVSQCNVIQVLSILELVRATQKTLKLNESYSYICSSITKISSENIIFFYFLSSFMHFCLSILSFSLGIAISLWENERLREGGREQEKKCFLHTKKKHKSAPHIVWYLIVTSFFFFILTADG